MEKYRLHNDNGILEMGKYQLYDDNGILEIRKWEPRKNDK